MTKKPVGPNTQLMHAGRKREWTHGIVNPPVYHASTCVFETMAEFDHTIANPDDGLYYGRRGTPTQWALESAMVETEPGAVGCKLTPSGVSAINAALLGILRPGDHLLMTDSAYEPTRYMCKGLLEEIGVQTTYYDPLIGAGISDLIQDNTRVIFCESPGSITFEVQDIKAISKAAKAHDICVMMDNTWATGVFFNPFEHGVDVSIQALTKYVVGHSDAMLGCVMANEAYWPRIEQSIYRLGLCAGPDDAYLGLRGLRTLRVRLEAHQRNALDVAKYLSGHDMVAHVLHPALPGAPGHDMWVRDFKGASGLFAFTLNGGDRDNLHSLIDELEHFSMGFSWGGYESLILPGRIFGIRTATQYDLPGPLIRLHIGLEDTADLIADLDAGLARYKSAL